MKKILFIIIDVLIVYFVFVGIDAYRIQSMSFEEVKPLITIDEEKTDDKTIYFGLGYSVTYNKNSDESIYGAEFRLFDKVLIWAYVS